MQRKTKPVNDYGYNNSNGEFIELKNHDTRTLSTKIPGDEEIAKGQIQAMRKKNIMCSLTTRKAAKQLRNRKREHEQSHVEENLPKKQKTDTESSSKTITEKPFVLPKEFYDALIKNHLFHELSTPPVNDQQATSSKKSYHS